MLNALAICAVSTVRNAVWKLEMQRRRPEFPGLRPIGILVRYARRIGRMSMRRRDFVAALACAAAWPIAARAQLATTRSLIAWLSGGGKPGSTVFVDAFLEGLQEHGYIEGRNV